jgi:glycosyltransferase involved in cell wall biosynthesis
LTRLRAIAVVIPARDESELIGACIDSVEAAAAKLRAETSLSVHITVVADGCSDDTASIASASRSTFVLPTPPIGVGAARRAGIQAMIGRVGIDPVAIWIANTDADSVVNESWLLNQLVADRSGAQVRVGAVKPKFDDLTDRQIEAWSQSHGGDAARGHIHGANLGVLASTYLSAGGFRPLLVREDVELVHRLGRAGAVIAADAIPDVITSGRSVGRAQGGYASYLSSSLP